MTLTEEQREAIRVISKLPMAIGCQLCHPYIMENYGSHFIVLRDMIDSSEHFTDHTKMIGFDLEAARAGISHYRIENPSNVDTESALKELVDQANLAEDAIAEIERLRAENEGLSKAVIDIQEERDLAQAEFRSYHRAWEEQAARVQELEEALVEMVATNPCNIPTLCDVVHDELMCPALDGNCDFWKGCPQKNELREAARKQLQAEGKIGPDAKPHCWQITEERKAALAAMSNLSETISCPDCGVWIGFADIGPHMAVLRAMLTEAGL